MTRRLRRWSLVGCVAVALVGCGEDEAGVGVDGSVLPSRADGGVSNDLGGGAGDVDLGRSDAASREDAATGDAGPRLDGDARTDASSVRDAGPGGEDADTGAPRADAFPAAPDGGPPQPVYNGVAPPFEQGALATRAVSVAEGEDGAPRALRVWAPTVPGRYPVVVFQHGFLVANDLYGPLLDRVATHGFVVVAPQMYVADGLPFGKPTSVEEADAAVTVVEWLRPRLAALAGVEVSWEHLALAGHSRGGQVAYRMALDVGAAAGALLALDPVDQSGPVCAPGGGLTSAPINLAMPALVLGTGQGGACAPMGCNHVQFWDATSAPVWHVVTPDNGHMDLLQDDLAACGLVCAFCPGAPAREPMRRATAGVMVAMLRGALFADAGARAWLAAPPAPPVSLEVEAR